MKKSVAVATDGCPKNGRRGDQEKKFWKREFKISVAAATEALTTRALISAKADDPTGVVEDKKDSEDGEDF